MQPIPIAYGSKVTLKLLQDLSTAGVPGTPYMAIDGEGWAGWFEDESGG